MLPPATAAIVVTVEGRGEGGGGGRTHVLLAFVIGPLTTHPFRDGAPFLYPIETPPTFGRSVRFFYIPYDFVCLSYLLPLWEGGGYEIGGRL